MTDTIIFDIGRVLVKFEWQEYLNSFSFDAATFEALGNAMFRSPAWNEYDRGAFEDEEILQRFISCAPEYEEEIRMVFKQFPSSLTVLPHTGSWLSGLKERGYRLYYLSNFAKTTRNFCGCLDFLDIMEGGLMSYEVQLLKPDPAFYQELFRRYQLCPETSVFIDDNQDNIAAGSSLGLKTILFTDFESASRQLEKYL